MIRKFCFWLVIMLIFTVAEAAYSGEQGTNISPMPIRIGLTPALLNYQHSLNRLWIGYLEEKLQRPVVFVQRDTYRETMDLIKQNRLNFAWICSYPYVQLRDSVKLVAVPVYKGNTLYQSYLIVHRDDNKTKSILDLKAKIFAYADPFSNTGYLVPRFNLKQRGIDADLFFRKTFFTWAHRNVIEAVAKHLADGGAVDSYIWESLNMLQPELTGKTRIVSKSKKFGFPPFVANAFVSEAEFTDMQQILLNMQNNKKGALILKGLNLDGFVTGSDNIYDSVAEMAKTFEK